MGEPQPDWVTPANGYTWLDLSKSPDYANLNQLAMRNILPATAFRCGGQLLPYKVAEATNTQSGAGLMGLYAPVIDFPTADALPPTAAPLTGNSTCATFPIGPPAVNSPTNQNCFVQLPPPTTITALTTQCSVPGCNQVVLQPKPPISVVGTGFGSLPQGLPYTGTTQTLEVDDLTQGWSAGFAGNTCTLTIGEWSNSLISMVANVNQNGVCPMAAGDQLKVTVTNPQTRISASFTTTVLAHAGGGPRKP
jgi:hypothetical protein